MDKELKFEGILRGYDNYKMNDKFVAVLLEKNIYTKETNYEYNSMDDHINKSLYPKPDLHASFVYKLNRYSINLKILEEIYNEMLDRIIYDNPLIHDAEIEFQLKAYFSKKQKLKFLQNEFFKANKEMANSPYTLIYFDKEYDGYENWKDFVFSSINESYIKEYLLEDLGDPCRSREKIADYRITKDISCTLDIFEFWSRCYKLSNIMNALNKKINEINQEELEGTPEVDISNHKALSIPKQIALLDATGFFNLEKVKQLTSDRLYQLVAMTIGKDPQDKSHIRAIRGNIQALKPDSSENRLKYTSGTHLAYFKKILE